MTVAELIEKLQTLPQNYYVLLNNRNTDTNFHVEPEIEVDAVSGDIIIHTGKLL